jgi:uncharacterized protein YqhQ
MALANGVLVHGPTAWACAVRTEDGVKVAARRKRFRAATVSNPLLRGPARLAEAFALLPQVKHALPEAELPMQRPRVLASLAGLGAVVASVETFGWMSRNPSHPLARLLAKPGHELQHRFGTREPTPAQLEVAEAALRACLELES